jgi:hypothetical protein
MCDRGRLSALRGHAPRVTRHDQGRVERARDKVERAIVRNLSDGRSWAEIGEQVGRRSRIVTADRYSHALIDYREVDRAVLRR